MKQTKNREPIQRLVFKAFPFVNTEERVGAKLRKFRISHPEFDTYLNDMTVLLNKEENRDFDGLKQFMECKTIKFGWRNRYFCN